MEDVKAFERDNSEIAIVGMAAKFAKASNIYEFWDNLLAGRDCVGECPKERRVDVEDYLDFCGIPNEQRKYRKASYLDHIDYFDYEFFHISPKEAKLMDPYQRMLLQTLYNVIEDAGYAGEQLSTKKIGIYTGFPTEYTSKVYQNLIMETNPSLANESFSGNLVAMLPARLAYYLDLHGPAYVIDTSCSSSLSALHLACQGIKTGDCEMAIASGINIFTIPLMNEIVGAIGILSPDGKAKSFDDSCEGVGQGEGVGAIFLKPLTKAIKDKDHIYAVIKSTAVNQDGKSIGITAPNANAQEAVIVEAWERANINPSTISYIEAHGTATKLGDPTEITGINRAFRRYTDNTQFCGVGSVKSNIGHTLGAAGVASVIKMALALENKKIPATIHFLKPNQRINFDASSVFINDRLRFWNCSEIKRCGVSSFGITGTNCHVVMEEGTKQGIATKQRLYEVFTVSASQLEVLVELIQSYIDFLKANENVNLADLCYTVNTGRRVLQYRIAIVACSPLDLMRKLERLLEVGFDVSNEIQYKNELIYLSMNCYGKEEDIEETIEETIEATTLLEDVDDYARLYVKRKCIDWSKLYGENYGTRISLPVYPFKKTRCWITIPKIKHKCDYDQMFYRPIWVSHACECQNQRKFDQEKFILVFTNGDQHVNEFIEILKARKLNVIEVHMGGKYEKRDKNLYIIRNKSDDFKQLFQSIELETIGHIIYGVTATGEDSDNYSINGLFYLGKEIQQFIKNQIHFILLTKNAYRVNKKEAFIRPINAALIGLIKTMKWEMQNLRFQCIDMDDEILVEDIASEMQSKSNEFLVSYRERKRFVERIERINLENIETSVFQFKSDGAYVILGGTGRIGRVIAKLLAKKRKIQLVLVHRTALPERTEWKKIIEENQNMELVRKVKELIAIEESGSKVILVQCDITDEEAMKQLFTKIREKYQIIRGIIQCAVDDTPLAIKDLSEKEFQRALNTKIKSTYMLSSITEKDSLDFFLTFSSVMTLVGGVGTASYMASNCFLEAFSQARTLNNFPSQVICWPEWLNIGLSEELMNSEDKSIFRKIKKETALDLMEILLYKKLDRVIVGEIQKESKIYDVIEYLPFRYTEQIIEEFHAKSEGEIVETDEDVVIEVNLTGRKTEIYSEVEKIIGQSICKVMGYETLNIYANFFELGGDSISAVKISVDLEDKNIIISAPDILKYQTLERMAEFVEGTTLKGGLRVQ